MPSQGAYPYQPVAKVRPRLPLPIDSPTLLTRRRYSRASVLGFEKGGTLAQAPTGTIAPHPWPGSGAEWSGFPYYPRSNVGVFMGGIVGNEADPDVVRMPIGIGINELVTIAHRSTYPAPLPAINAGLWARTSKTVSASPAQAPGRRYSLPYQIGTNQTNQTWPTSSQWLAGQMAGTSS